MDDLSHVELIGGVQKSRINRDLPNIRNRRRRYSSAPPLVDVKAAAIQDWMERVLSRINHFKNEHLALLKEFTTLLELVLWKAKLDQEFGESLSKEDNATANKVKIDIKTFRQEQRITSGASVVIKNVLPFLKLE